MKYTIFLSAFPFPCRAKCKSSLCRRFCSIQFIEGSHFCFVFVFLIILRDGCHSLSSKLMHYCSSIGIGLVCGAKKRHIIHGGKRNWIGSTWYMENGAGFSSDVNVLLLHNLAYTRELEFYKISAQSIAYFCLSHFVASICFHLTCLLLASMIAFAHMFFYCSL